MRRFIYILISLILERLNHSTAFPTNIQFLSPLNLFHSELNLPCTRNSFTKTKMIWAYPIYGDSPNKLRRKKIDPIWEIGENRPVIKWDYQIANNLAQGCNYIPWHGSVVQYEEIGLGKTEKMSVTAEQAVGGLDIDPEEVKKIKTVLPTFDQGNGIGIATLLSARKGHFSFKYNGLIRHRFGFQNYLRYMICQVYPNAKVTLISEHWTDPDDRPSSSRSHNVPLSLTSEQRKRITWKYPYQYENEKNSTLPESTGADILPQPL